MEFALRGFHQVLNNCMVHFSQLDQSQGSAMAVSSSKEEENALAKQVLDTYGNQILRLAYSFLHNLEDAEDILQDTLIQFIDKKPLVVSKTHEKAWLMRVASNLSKNKIKYNSIRKTDALDEALHAQEKSDLSFLWEAVKSLPGTYRACIHLHYYEGYTSAEISTILDMKESTVRSNLLRGREKLKSILKEAFDFDE